jgi:hypothetical protein
MQPVPTHTSRSFTSAAAFRRMGSLAGLALISAPLAFVGCRDPKVTNYRVPKEAAAELPASAPVRAPAAPVDATMPTDATHAGLAAGAAAPASGAMPNTPGLQTASGNELSWTAPAAWQPKPASMMRKATYTVPADGGATGELAISAFPGDVGGEPANVNRWRGQVGLEPLSDAAAVAAIARVEANGLKIGVVDLPGASGRLLGAMVPYAGATWFFKLTGPDAAVGAAKPAFLEFLRTLKPAATSTP